MFSSLKVRILVGVYIFLILSIPIGAYLASQQQTIKGQASQEKKTAKPVPTASPSSTKQLQEAAKKKVTSQSPSPSPTPEPTTTVATSFGPTLALKILLEGRPTDNKATSLFVGIVEGVISGSPKFLLSFSIDLPSSGEYDNLSLAGLSAGSTYTAILKGTAQIATSSAFLMSPSVTNLNGGQPLTLLSGDLNDDNLINSADYAVAKNAFGSAPSESDWNENVDFNKDGRINSLDIALIVKNFGKVGVSGAWVSPLPQIASQSANLIPNPSTLPVGSQGATNSGYWIWIPGSL
ncbi:hypothetical protein HYT18_02280 [Candidatus Microgenomates bacterium]|nr:hypothetical protein [Candidatus Microgenomates bacterium]